MFDWDQAFSVGRVMKAPRAATGQFYTAATVFLKTFHLSSKRALSIVDGNYCRSSELATSSTFAMAFTCLY